MEIVPDSNKAFFFKEIECYFKTLQTQICDALQQEDGQKTWLYDPWTSSKGYGLTCILEEGAVFEKAGVNVSSVHGQKLPPSASELYPQCSQQPFWATGLSLVTHPQNPYVPTSHMNLRFFLAETSEQESIWWFGGGFDLTPYYGFHQDCQHWHTEAYKACNPFGESVYPRFKDGCDRYFYLKHRQEPRGIGGLFFDHLNSWPIEKCFALVKSIGDHYLPAYQPIIACRKKTPYGDREKAFQCYRRGRYVEFNLVYDRGTLFGLQFGGRIESILISLPPKVSWSYAFQTQSGTPEAEFYKTFLAPRDWLSLPPFHE